MYGVELNSFKREGKTMNLNFIIELLKVGRFTFSYNVKILAGRLSYIHLGISHNGNTEHTGSWIMSLIWKLYYLDGCC